MHPRYLEHPTALHILCYTSLIYMYSHPGCEGSAMHGLFLYKGIFS